MHQFFKKHFFIIFLSLILFVGIGARLYKLGEVPHGMTWDEVAIGYNGFAIWHTRRDEWLERLPASFKSFGDYKAPLAIYLNAPFTFLFGMNLLAVRLPFFLASILVLIGFILLIQEVFNDRFYVLVGVLLLATSPWHIHYSRTGFESGLALSFFIWALYLLIKSLKLNFTKWYSTLLSGLLFVLSIYSYHSAKVVIPLTLLLFLLVFRKRVIKSYRKLFIPTIVSLALLYPLVKDAVYGEGLARAGVTIFAQKMSFLEKMVYILKSYLVHLSPQFLLFAQTTTLRHSAGYMGVLLATTFILFIFGLVLFFRRKKNYLQQQDTFKVKLLSFFIYLIIIGLLPACMAMEVPHSNRALLALPGFFIVSMFGLEYLKNVLLRSRINQQTRGSYNEKNIIVKSVLGFLLLTHILLFISFLSYYFTTFAKKSTNDFKDGYLEAFHIAHNYEKGLGVEMVDKIIFTSDYGQPYIYALFVRKTNPIWYQGGSLIKYEFSDKINVSDLARKNALIVASNKDEMPLEKADYLVYGSDGQVRFKIYKTKKE